MDRCQICLSPYRSEIELCIKKNVLRTDIARHYCEVMGVTYESLYKSVLGHEKRKHPPLISNLPELSINKPKLDEEDKTEQVKQFPKTMEGFAQMLLERGFTPEQMNKLTPGHIINAQKLLLEKEKIQNQKDAMKLTMAKLFAGYLTEKDIKEGELVEDGETQRPGIHSGATETT